MDLNLDEVGREMRLSIEVRNRQHLKRKFKNCFVGAEAVSWLLSASYAATRQEAVSIGKNLITKKLIRHVTDGHSFKDAFLYYRFTLDDPGVANLHTVCAGRGRYSISKVRIADMAQAQTQAQANQPSPSNKQQINSTCSSSSNSTEPTYETTDCPFKFSAHTGEPKLTTVSNSECLRRCGRFSDSACFHIRADGLLWTVLEQSLCTKNALGRTRHHRVQFWASKTSIRWSYGQIPRDSPFSFFFDNIFP